MMNKGQATLPAQQPWQKKFPSVVAGIFSFIQFIVTIVIIGCEVGSMLIDMFTATIYVGLWASLFFMCAWISQAVASCCCRHRGCATYTLIIQIISMFFACCVIGFDSYYIMRPTTCFFSSSLCSSSASVRGLFYSDANFNNIKIPLIKGQLAAGALMFVLCLVYIIIYVITSTQVSQAKRSSTVHPQAQNLYPTLPSTSNGIATAPPMNSYRPSSTISNDNSRTTVLVCPACNTAMDMTINKRSPQ